MFATFYLSCYSVFTNFKFGIMKFISAVIINLNLSMMFLIKDSVSAVSALVYDN